MRLLSSLVAAAFCGVGLGAVRAQEPVNVDAMLEKIRAQQGLPALCAAMIREGRIVAIGVAGVRQYGVTARATTLDKWHVGSCTKSMTASLAAMLVEDGTLKWETTVGEVFPDTKMAAPWKDVTLEQLLTHRAGAPHDPPADLWTAAWLRLGPPSEQRAAFVRGLLLTPPVSAPGTAFLYSNQGYSIAGAMMEKRTQIPWETLMRQRLFGPLGMKSAGFGAAATPDKVDAPWGHLVRDGQIVPVPGGPQSDNPPAIGPGGTVHCSITDFATFAGWHARGARAGKTLLSDASFTKLHTPATGGDYAMGWAVVERPWAGGRALTHTGSNTMNYAVMWVAPEKEAAFVAATNIAGENASKACDEAISELIKEWLK